MARATFNALVFPYYITPDRQIDYAVFNRSDAVEDFWQAISGGGEDDETPLEAARRESWEEAGISPESSFIALDSMTTIPVYHYGYTWDKDTYVVSEYSFGVQVEDRSLRLSHEHTEYRWLDFQAATEILKFDSNKNALWELDQRLHRMLQKES